MYKLINGRLVKQTNTTYIKQTVEEEETKNKDDDNEDENIINRHEELMDMTLKTLKGKGIDPKNMSDRERLLIKIKNVKVLQDVLENEQAQNKSGKKKFINFNI